MTAPPNSLSGAAGLSSTFELISETAERIV